MENIPYIPELPCSTWATKDQVVAECDRLRSEIAELKRKLEYQRNAYQERFSECDKYRKQLAESQAREARLREALSELTELMEGVYTGDYHPDSFTNQPAREALALPHDDTALKEYLAAEKEKSNV